VKVSYLHISNYKQFSDLELDLTYPKGHPKAGEPLDKICIIGQSGTGKTNLLEIINCSTSDHQYLDYHLGEYSYTEYGHIQIDYKLINNQSAQIKFHPPSEPTGIELVEDEEIYFLSTEKKETERTWINLKDKINNYAKERLEYVDTLSNKLLSIDNYEKKDFLKEIKSWEDKNSNILEQISDKLNEILVKFNLKLTKLDKNALRYTKLEFEDLSNGRIVGYNQVSTGTKNLIATFISLKDYNPKDSIILIDEPEMSFYPNIQRQLTDLYMGVGENNQLIMATHSPLIASSFEPWEVVELKFDNHNQIYREKYYEGENHVDNYTLDPRMLTWTGILTDVFDMTEDSNFSFREKKLMEYATLKAEIKAIDDISQKEEKFKELKKISKILGLNN